MSEEFNRISLANLLVGEPMTDEEISQHRTFALMSLFSESRYQPDIDEIRLVDRLLQLKEGKGLEGAEIYPPLTDEEFKEIHTTAHKGPALKPSEMSRSQTKLRLIQEILRLERLTHSPD